MAGRSLKYGLLIFILLLLTTVVWQSYFMNKPLSPKYDILSSSGNIELREYPEMILAGVTVNGHRKSALSDGFKQLADYIFGNNKPADGSSPEGVHIKMTAPVTQHGSHKGDQWEIFFVMPEDYCLGDLPIPNNPNVKVTDQDEQKVLAIRFSGFNTDANLNDHLHKLQAFASHNHIKVGKEIVMAYYDPPWVLPFIRRNEIWLKVD